MTGSEPPGPRLRAAVLLVGVLSIAVPAFVVRHPPSFPARAGSLARTPRHVVPPTMLPAVEPVEFVDLPPDEARAYNASVPFSTDPVPAARAFRLRGSADDLARATDCLAAAVLYEAGDDPAGERAVAQVVVNRVRHPAFPKTVCGVVFEGQDRATGCQFSFSCDGALTRWTPGAAQWDRARAVAKAALGGAVYRPVGYATHYHTDWVVPYWQSSLDKIARVGSHLFFRWTGWWGTPPAFTRAVAGDEPLVAQLAHLSDAHRSAAVLAEADAALAEATAALGFAMEADPALAAAPAATSATATAVADGDPATFLVRLDPRQPADGYRGVALALCGDAPRCTVMGWTAAAAKADALPLTPQQMASMSFSYLRDRPAGLERTLWNCTEFRRTRMPECMKRAAVLTAEPIAQPPSPDTGAVPPLAGIRRRPPAPLTSPRTAPRPAADDPPGRPASPTAR